MKDFMGYGCRHDNWQRERFECKESCGYKNDNFLHTNGDGKCLKYIDKPQEPIPA